MNREQKYALLATLAISLGGGASLLFGIANIVWSGGYVAAIIYGVLLLIIAIAAAATAVLYNTKWKDEQMNRGMALSLLPIWLIEATALLAIDYVNVWRNGVAVTLFVFTILIIFFGSMGMTLIRRGRIPLGRVFVMIFLGIDFIGSILGFVGSGNALVIIGNVVRLGAIGLVVAVLFMTKGISPLTSVSGSSNYEPSSNGPSYENGSHEVETRRESERPVPPLEEKKEKTLHDKLSEAKKLYDDGLISEEEYALLKKKAIDGE